MPYIPSKPERYRRELNVHIDALATTLRNHARDRAKDKLIGKGVEDGDLNDEVLLAPATTLELAGFLNYACTRLTASIAPDPLSYSTIALISGVFRNIADEFYRRVATPYENHQVEKNGDVYPDRLIEEDGLTTPWDKMHLRGTPGHGPSGK